VAAALVVIAMCAAWLNGGLVAVLNWRGTARVAQLEQEGVYDVVIAGVDWGVANVFYLYDSAGRKACMSQGEYRALAKLDSNERQCAAWIKEARLPTLPELRRPHVETVLTYLCVLYAAFDGFIEEYGSDLRKHANLTVRTRAPFLHPSVLTLGEYVVAV
jgi:hypothetical protein